MCPAPARAVRWTVSVATALVATWLPQGTPGAERPVRSLLEARHEGVIVQRWDTSCGAAALATLLTFDRRHPVSEQDVAVGMLRRSDPMRVRHRGGFSLLDMKRYAEQAGFAAEGWHGMNYDDLRARAPLVVPVRLRGYDHFVVIRRVDDDGVEVADPGFGRYWMRRSAFTRDWAGVGFTVTDHAAVR